MENDLLALSARIISRWHIFFFSTAIAAKVVTLKQQDAYCSEQFARTFFCWRNLLVKEKTWIILKAFHQNIRCVFRSNFIKMAMNNCVVHLFRLSSNARNLYRKWKMEYLNKRSFLLTFYIIFDRINSEFHELKLRWKSFRSPFRGTVSFSFPFEHKIIYLCT